MRAHTISIAMLCSTLAACSDGGGSGGGAGAPSGNGGTGGNGAGSFGGSGGAGSSTGTGGSSGSGSTTGSGGEPCYWPVTMSFNIHSPEVTIHKDAKEKYYVCLGTFASNPTESWKSPGVKSYLFADTVGTVHPDGTETVGLQISEAIAMDAEPGYAPGPWNWSAGVYMAPCPDDDPTDYESDQSWRVNTNVDGVYTIECNQLPFVIDVELSLKP